MKRLLAYSSIENIGIIVAGIGLAILFTAYDKTLLAALALTAVLYHCLNHAFFKSLLFLATGSVLHATQRAQPRQARRAHPPHAVGRAGSRSSARSRSPACRRSTASSRSGCCCRRSCSRRGCRSRSSTCWCRSPPRRSCWSAALAGLRDGQVLRRRLPRPAARGRTSPTRRTRAAASASALVWLAAGCVAARPASRCNVIALLDPVTRCSSDRRAPQPVARATGCCSRRSAPTARATAR